MESLIDVMRNYIDKTKDDWNYITPTDFYHKYYIKNKDYLLIDLRDKKSFNKSHVKGAINIFWMDILKQKNLEKLSKKIPIFLICYVGHTSSQVLVMLKMLGYKVIAIKFGYGISPVFEVPVAGWINYNYETTSS
jgi:rhodanese-related sulfurtransferase